MYSVEKATVVHRGSRTTGDRRAAGQRPLAQPAVAAPPAAGPDYARLLGDARRVLGLSEEALAMRLGVEPGVVRALESGRLAELPRWDETARVVSTLLNALSIDPRPVLHALAVDLAARNERSGAAASRPGLQRAPQPASPPARPQRAAAGGAAVSAAARRLRSVVAVPFRSSVSVVGGALARVRPARGPVARLGRRAVRRTVLGMAIPALIALAVANPDAARALWSRLPAPVSRAMADATEHIRLQLAPVRDGLRWILVDDPRSRRGDKLQTARR
jgi:transcriptional regulator with XRE-family HTH domain